ncbi:MAG: hypothetical protein Q4G08_01580 [Capnocytophaga sp.]|nr:hypothetical protein [Capnocytophaga sp.]
MKRYIMLSAALLGVAFSYGQDKNTDYKPIDLNLQVKTMHLWRGYRVTDAALSAATLAYTSPDGHWKAGFWGGYSFNGQYTEFDNFVEYSNKGFYVGLWDINNFSDYPNAKFFSYKHNGSRFVDLTLAYQLQNEKFPLRLSVSTILFGRDFYTENNDTKSRYSTYIDLSSRVWRQGSSQLTAGVAGAFALRNGDDMTAHFYGEKANLVNVYLQYSKNITVLNHTMPVSALAMYNPERQIGGLQFAINLF